MTSSQATSSQGEPHCTNCDHVQAYHQTAGACTYAGRGRQCGCSAFQAGELQAGSQGCQDEPQPQPQPIELPSRIICRTEAAEFLKRHRYANMEITNLGDRWIFQARIYLEMKADKELRTEKEN